MIGWVKSWLHDVLSRFISNKRGNVAMIFGLSLLPLVAAGGVAVDMSRAMIVRHRLSEALDAAGLAAGREFDQGLDAVTAVAQQYFAANYPEAELGVPAQIQVAMEGSTISLSVTADVETTLMNVLGFDYLNVGVSSEITRSGKSLEIALALDVTGSMSGQKIIDLKTAAKDLIDTVVWDSQGGEFTSKVALVPFSMGVNVGAYANAVRGAPTAPLPVTSATWGKPITGATWKSGTAKTITGVTQFAAAARNITGATRASPVVITSGTHGLNTGNIVWIQGVNGMTQLNNRYYTVTRLTSSTYSLNGVNGTTYSSYTSGGTGRRCTVAQCSPVVTSNTHGFANGDTVYISGVGGMTQINNQKFTVANAATNTFSLSGVEGGAYSTYTSGGTAQECLNSGCYVVVTAASHGFTNGNTVYIDGVGGMTQINDDDYTVASSTTNTFVLSGEVGTSYGNYTSGGQVCVTSNCPVTITSNAHGFANGAYVYITDVGGMTELNGNTYTVASATTNTFQLSGTNGSNFSAHTSGGNVYCTTSGCQYYRFLNASGWSPTYKMYEITTCATERVGTDAYTDVAPSTSYVGRNYAPSDAPCLSSQIVPLTSNKDYLKAQIDLFTAQGTTAGQIGFAWAWYMISPNFAYIFPSSSQGVAYDSADTLKMAVLMTDGEFNTAYCNGVLSADSDAGSSSDRINCNATNGLAASQAPNVCTAMKSAGVEVYTVGFQLSVQSAIDMLNACATNAEQAFVADNGAELLAAFDAIATDISELRVSK
jgi:Flp pilus assembly protein TadG